MEGFSVSGRPAVLWSDPLPSGVVSPRREGGHGVPRGLCAEQDQAADSAFPSLVRVTQGICRTHAASWLPSGRGSVSSRSLGLASAFSSAVCSNGADLAPWL